VIKPLGLAWRAEFLKTLGKSLVKKAGRVPLEYDELVALPGVGPYAASAFLSLHCGKRSVIIDSNVVRIYSRLLGQSYDGETRRKKWVAEFADSITPRDDFKKFNYALLDFTRVLCSPRPRCSDCPLKEFCQYQLAERSAASATHQGPLR